MKSRECNRLYDGKSDSIAPFLFIFSHISSFNGRKTFLSPFFYAISLFPTRDSVKKMEEVRENIIRELEKVGIFDEIVLEFQRVESKIWWLESTKKV